ncbi:hypothetical protein [Salinimicrobium sp. GXAS 041]|uniref:hypothetical protein n=1 Tax=Salinimicrobium sp. GXAS 041 TaxID=3400806 RepID=UPI003C744EA2
MKTIPLQKILLYAAVVVLAFLLFRQCDKTAEQRKEKNSIQAFLNDTISYYDNEIGQEVAQKEAIQGSKQALEVLLSEKMDSLGQLKRLVKNFRNVDAAGNVTTVTIIDSIPVPYEVPVPMEFSRDFEKSTQFYSLSGISTNRGLTINNLTVPNTLSFAIGKKKTGLFSSEYRIEAVNSNPYVLTTGLDSYTFKSSKGLISLDAQIGYGLTVYGATPYAGVGLGFDLWEGLRSVFGKR